MRTTRFGLMLGLLLATALAIPARSHASPVTVYSNFGPGYSYSSGGYYTNVFISSGVEYDLAGQFTVGASSAYFDSATLALWCSCGSDFTLWLMDGSFNILESVLYTAPLGGFGSTVTVQGAGTTLLNANTTYWLGVSTNGTDNVYWYVNNTGDNAQMAWRLNGGAWTPWNNGNMALEVSGTAVPEPSTLLLLGAGLATVAARRRLTKRT
jgi:hypothetical protein